MATKLHMMAHLSALDPLPAPDRHRPAVDDLLPMLLSKQLRLPLLRQLELHLAHQPLGAHLRLPGAHLARQRLQAHP